MTVIINVKVVGTFLSGKGETTKFACKLTYKSYVFKSCCIQERRMNWKKKKKRY